MNLKRIIEVRCASALPPGGHYAQAILHGDTLYISGQLGVTGGTAGAGGVPIADQVRFALGNVMAIARVVGAHTEDVVRCTLYVTDVAYWPEVNSAYADVFGSHRPARSIVPSGPLHHGALVEIEAEVSVNI